MTYYTVLKIFLAVLLFGCLLPMPFSYYNFIRLAEFIGFLIFTYKAIKNEKSIAALGLFIIAVIFNPFSRLTMKKFDWNIIDVAVALFLIFWILIEVKSEEKNLDKPK
jgi:hypothetical protein